MLPSEPALNELVKQLDAVLRGRVPDDPESRQAELNLIMGIRAYCRLQASLEGIETVIGSLGEKPGTANIQAAARAVAQVEPETLKRLDAGVNVCAALEGARQTLRELLRQKPGQPNLRSRLNGVLEPVARGLINLTKEVVKTVQEASAEVMLSLEGIAEASTNETRRVFEDHFANFEPHKLEDHFILANRNLPHKRRHELKSEGR